MPHPLMPADTPAYMEDAWAGCVVWAAGEPEVVQAFRTDTGIAWTPSANALARMIDHATGAERAFCEAFVKWVNSRVWGPMDAAPPESQE